uniref:Uncharacterized protein n=1 Tax=Physcomitrium patens TaxID=3218 RepID=A0A2K1IEK4_PHYPA|nr:hypothetical protein PHYPA_029863 [Physcomitrium patens]
MGFTVRRTLIALHLSWHWVLQLLVPSHSNASPMGALILQSSATREVSLTERDGDR